MELVIFVIYKDFSEIVIKKFCVFFGFVALVN